jgi:hypothetical protein
MSMEAIEELLLERLETAGVSMRPASDKPGMHRGGCPHCGKGDRLQIGPRLDGSGYWLKCYACNSTQDILTVLELGWSDLRAGDSVGAHRWELQPLSEVKPRQGRWLIPGLIPLRAQTLVAGVGGHGKSTWALSRAAELSLKDIATIVISFEDTAEEKILPRVVAAGGNPAHIYQMKLPDNSDLSMVQLPQDFEELRRLVRSVKARLIIIDPVVASIETSLDAHKDQHVRSVLGRLAALVEEEDAAAVLIGHLNKAPTADAYLRVANSTAFWNACRSVVLIAAEDDQHTLVAQRKANWSRMQPVERHRIEEVLTDLRDEESGEQIIESRMVFVGIADDVDGADLLAAKQQEPKWEQAANAICDALADGPRPPAEVKREIALKVPAGSATVERAAKQLELEGVLGRAGSNQHDAAWCLLAVPHQGSTKSDDAAPNPGVYGEVVLPHHDMGNPDVADDAADTLAASNGAADDRERLAAELRRLQGQGS